MEAICHDYKKNKHIFVNEFGKLNNLVKSHSSKVISQGQFSVT